MNRAICLFILIVFGISSCQNDGNDIISPPEIEDQVTNVEENAVAGTVVDTIDAPQNVAFAIVGGNIDGAFHIDRTSGVLTVGNSHILDYESLRKFELAIEIVDEATSLSSTATVIVNVLNVEIPKNGLMAHYKFEGTAFDQTLNSFNGAGFNTSYVASKDALNDMSVYLNGNDSYVKLPVDFDIEERTISLWFSASNVSGTQRIYYSDHADLDYGSTNISLRRDIYSGTNYLKLECGGGQGEDLEIEIHENIWNHAVITVGKVVVTAYLNGHPYDSAPVVYHNSVDGNPNAYLGCSRNENDYFFDGLIDEVAIYNRVLSIEEVKTLYKE